MGDGRFTGLWRPVLLPLVLDEDHMDDTAVQRWFTVMYGYGEVMLRFQLPRRSPPTTGSQTSPAADAAR